MNEQTFCLVKLLYDEPHFVLITTGIAERAVDQSSINLLTSLYHPKPNRSFYIFDRINLSGLIHKIIS